MDYPMMFLMGIFVIFLLYLVTVVYFASRITKNHHDDNRSESQ